MAVKRRRMTMIAGAVKLVWGDNEENARITQAGYIFGTTAIVGVVSLTLAVHGQDMQFGDEASIKYSQELWAAFDTAKVVGANAMASKPYEGQEPHGAILETLETNITVGGHTGVAWVKRNYGPGGITIEQVTNDPKKHLEAVTVMHKREAGYGPDNKDWFWVKSLHKNPKGVQLAGRVAKGMDKGCIACHSAADGGDYFFRND